MKKALMAILAVSILILSACSDTAPEAPERVMLAVDCGWRDVEAIGPYYQFGLVVITDSLDNFTEAHTFTGILSPETADPSSFHNPAILLERHDTTDSIARSFPSPYDVIVSEQEDYQYLTDTLAALTFSQDISARHEFYGRVTLSTFEIVEGSWKRTNRYYICADGVVLKEGEENGIICYYESLTPVDYYQISALEIKYSTFNYPLYWEGNVSREEMPETYRLCISGKDFHRDFTLEEAIELLPSPYSSNGQDRILEGQVNQIHPSYPDEEYLKITEYTLHYITEDDTRVEENTYYLSPDGKLTRFRTSAGFNYISHKPGETRDWEYFYLYLGWVSEDTFDYNTFKQLLDEAPAN